MSRKRIKNTAAVIAGLCIFMVCVNGAMAVAVAFLSKVRRRWRLPIRPSAVAAYMHAAPTSVDDSASGGAQTFPVL